jgi:hypothetical protein
LRIIRHVGWLWWKRINTNCFKISSLMVRSLSSPTVFLLKNKYPDPYFTQRFIISHCILSRARWFQSSFPTSLHRKLTLSIQAVNTCTTFFNILWRIDPLLGNDSVHTFKRTRNNGSCVLCEPCYGTLLRNTTILKTSNTSNTALSLIYTLQFILTPTH